MSYESADGYKIRNEHGLHFMTFTVVDWIDLFSRQLQGHFGKKHAALQVKETAFDRRLCNNDESYACYLAV